MRKTFLMMIPITGSFVCAMAFAVPGAAAYSQYYRPTYPSYTYPVCHYYGPNGACYHYSYRDYRPYYPPYNYHRDNLSYHPYDIRSRTPARCTYRYGRYERYTRDCTERRYYR